ncbi:sensor domain-containing diguanylate cyclase [Aeromonas media]|uniref:sensor domain-containing diguanylate cyclase n=1 Tax=Aeromonas media TaxID=651 RepID=UPI0029DD2830|nr:diguanylate cyclase [Aeromonas media]MDX7901582.1 diguanylate cyclase [Aeromonas media]
MNTPVNSFIDMGPLERYDALARLTALDRAYGIVEFDLDGRMVSVNGLFCDLLGYGSEEMIGQSHLLFLPPEQQEKHDSFWRGVLSGEIRSGEFRRIMRGGGSVWIHATYMPVTDEAGTLLGVIKLAHDITSEVLAKQRVEQQSQLFDIVVAAHQSFLLDRNLGSACDTVFERLLSVSQSAYGFIGIIQYEEDRPSLYIPSISNISWDEATHAWYEQQRQSRGGLIFSKLDNLFGHVVTHNTLVCCNDLPSHPASRGVSPRGHPHLDSFLGIPIRHKGEAIGMIALANRPGGFDETLVSLLEPLTTALGTLIHARNLEDERSRMERVLRFNAEHDFLTRLPNRSSFFSQANVLLEHIQRHPAEGEACCLALIDIDFFKQINDEHGHLAGDAVLEELARLLMQAVRSQDLVARFGGEEFIMLLRGTTLEEARAIMDRTRQQIEQHPFLHQHQAIAVTISVGLTPYQMSYRCMDDWLLCVDQRLYEAKRQGRNRIA